MQRATLKNLQTFILLSIFTFSLFFLDRSNLLYYPKYGVTYLLNPLQKIILDTKNSLVFELSILGKVRYLNLENRALKEQLFQIENDLVEFKDIQKENEALKKQFDYDLNAKELLPAQVISQGEEFIIDKGSSSGIEKDQVVILQNTLVGKIENVYPNSSTVSLPSTTNSEISAEVLSEGRGPQGLVFGRFGNELLLDKILAEESLEVGDLVVTLGEEKIYPKGLIIGKVDKVLDSKGEPFKSAVLKPLIDYDQISTVFVVPRIN